MRPFNPLRYRNTSVCAVIAMLLLASAAGAAEPAAPDSEDFRRGRLALRGKNWPLAIEHLTRAQEKFPDHPQILLGLAAAHQNSRQLLPAMAWYQAYLRLDVPESEALQAREQLESLDVIVRTMIDKLFAESVKLAEAALRPTELARGVIAAGKQDSHPDIARSKHGDLQKIAAIQAAAGLLSQAEATMRQSEVRHEVPVNRGIYISGQPKGLTGTYWLALAETASISPLGDIYGKLEGDAKREAFELLQLCHIHRYVMKCTPNSVAKMVREFTNDPLLEHLDIKSRDALRPGDVQPAHLALAEIARHASLALLRVRALALEPWERASVNPEMPDETFAFLRDWLFAICDGEFASRLTRRNLIASKSSYGGDLFASHTPILARAFALFPNANALTFQLRNNERWWPLLTLVWKSDDPAAVALAREFALINYGPATRDQHRNTPLHVACSGANLPAIKLLLERGGDVTIANYQGNTPLHNAAGSSMDEPDVIELLIAHKADVSARNYNGDTALHLAAGRDCNKMIKALCAHGAKLEQTNGAGKTPLQIAKEKMHQDATQILLQLGAVR